MCAPSSSTATGAALLLAAVQHSKLKPSMPICHSTTHCYPAACLAVRNTESDCPAGRCITTWRHGTTSSSSLTAPTPRCSRRALPCPTAPQTQARLAASRVSKHVLQMRRRTGLAPQHLCGGPVPGGRNGGVRQARCAGERLTVKCRRASPLVKSGMDVRRLLWDTGQAD